jgi:hypothetical protein
MPLIEIYANNNDRGFLQTLSRKLALMIFYINNKTEQGIKLKVGGVGEFRHGGVWGTPWRRYTFWEGCSFVAVVDKAFTIDTCAFLGDGRYGEQDIIASCELLYNEVSNIYLYSGLGPLRWVAPIPLVLGQYYQGRSWQLAQWFLYCRQYIKVRSKKFN